MRREYSDQKLIDKENKYFDIYWQLPFIISCLIFIVFCIWGILDACLITYNIYLLEGTTVEKYGIMRLDNRFVCWVIWASIGLVIATIIYWIGKIALSQKILTVIYLKKISDYCSDDGDAENISELERLYQRFSAGKMTKAEYEAAIRAYDAKIKEEYKLK